MPLSAVADMALSCPLCAWIHRRIQVNYLAAGKHSIRSQLGFEPAASGSPAWPCTMKERKKGLRYIQKLLYIGLPIL